MRIVDGAPDTVAGWVSGQIPGNPDFISRRDAFGRRMYHAIGAVEDTELGSKIVAGIVYHNYVAEYGNIELSMAAISPVWAKRHIIAAFLHYPFEVCGCKRVTTMTPAKNRRALKFNEHIGFVREGVVRRGFGTDDMVICGLLREEAERWLKYYGKESA